MEFTTSNGISIELLPWTSCGFKINKIHIIERIGGDFASGEISLILNRKDKSSSLVTDQVTGTLKIKDVEKNNGISYTIPIYIISRDFLKNLLNIKFICIPDIEFISKVRSTTFEDITDALNLLYKGNKDIRIKSDLNNKVKIYQTCQTDYDLCTKLAYSLKKSSVFSYSFSGLIIKDLCGEFDSNGNKEPNIPVVGGYKMFPISGYKLNYDAKIDTAIFDPWKDKDNSTTQQNYSTLESNNGITIMNFNEYRICGKDYNQLIENYQFNKNLMNPKLYSTLLISGQYIPKYKIGDAVSYNYLEDLNLPFKKYLVASNELFIATDGTDELSPNGHMFEWISELWGLDRGNWNNKL